VLAEAVARRDLNGIDDIAAVINSRIRRRTGALVPLPAPAWSDQVPAAGDPERRAYLTQVAALMDARKERLGEHAAATALPWAVAALGEVPADPEARLEWQRRAASVGAYRELSGHDDAADPVGPEPAANNPDLRAAWHEALAALGPAGGPDVRGMTDGLLLRLRDTYPVETAWAPPWVADELRQARAAARDAHLGALRAAAEANAARRRGEPSGPERLRTELAEKTHLRIARGLARPAPAIVTVALHQPGRLVVAEKRRQPFGDHAPLQPPVVDRERDFDTPEQIPIHPVRARQIHLFLATVVEIEDPMVFEKAPDNRTHGDVLRQARHARLQRTHTTHDQIDLHAGLRRFVQLGDHGRFEEVAGEVGAATAG